MTETDATRNLSEREVHIVVGCSDAREVGASFDAAVASARRKYAERGVAIELHILRTAGSFVTLDVIDDLKRIVESAERRAVRRARYYVHLQTHGEVTNDPSAETFALDRYGIVDGSPFNCGMLGATRLSLELERYVLAQKPDVLVFGGSRRLTNDDDLRQLLSDVYGHRGSIAGDWIRSIDDLRTHSRTQSAALRRAVDGDRLLRSVSPTITAGIHDYRSESYVRLDGEDAHRTFWDDVYAELRVLEPPDAPDATHRTAPQRPKLAVITTCEEPSVRRHAAEHLSRVEARDAEPFTANQVFTFASDCFDLPRTPFGPYSIAGFFYAVVHLGLRDFVIVGHDVDQSLRIRARFQNDPLVACICDGHGVRFHCTTMEGSAHAEHGGAHA